MRKTVYLVCDSQTGGIRLRKRKDRAKLGYGQALVCLEITFPDPPPVSTVKVEFPPLGPAEASVRPQQEQEVPVTKLPTIEEMSGLVDDLTGGLPLADYLKDRL